MATRKSRKTKTTKAAYQVPPGHVLVMRTCKPDMTSHNGFGWPKSGHVECSDWTATPECGQGLHGFLWGEGDGSLANWDSDAVWLVVEVNADCVVEIPTGKVKFQSGTVVHCGTRETATTFVREHAAGARSIVGGTSTSGDRGTSTSGYGGTSTSGYGGTSTSGDGGTSTSGSWGTSTSGDRGTSTSGDRGTSTSGYGGTSKTGSVGIVVCRWYDGARYRLTVGYVGEDGIKPDAFYRCDDQGKLVEVSK